MYTFTYRFYPGAGDAEEFAGAVWSYLGALYRNGQLVGSDCVVARAENHLECACVGPERGSLSPAYFNMEAQECYKRLSAISGRDPEAAVVGVTLEERICECGCPSAFALFTTYLRIAPPVICIDCGGHVPLYRFADVDENSSICSRIGIWESTYQACDTLYMDSGIGEVYGLRQMRDPRSKLSLQGMDICRSLSDRLGKPVYYFLFNPKGWKACPVCGSEWREGAPMTRFDFLCDNCSVVSLESCEA